MDEPIGWVRALVGPGAETTSRMRARPDIEVADVAAAQARIIELDGGETLRPTDGLRATGSAGG